MNRPNRTDHIRITSHPEPGGKPRFPIHWGAADGARTRPDHRHGVAARRPQRHRQPRRLLRALSRARGLLRRARSDPPPGPHQHLTGREHRPVRRNGASRARSCRSIRGAISSREAFKTEIAEGVDIRPTIAVTKARLDLHEMQLALSPPAGSRPTATSCMPTAASRWSKIAIDPVWYLPGIAERFGCTETILRRTLFEQTAGMFPELVTRPDMDVFLPPIGGTTVYLFGDVDEACRSDAPRSPAACMTSATAPTCSAPTSAPAGPISIHGIEECARAGAGRRPRHHRL